jgi:hypothetical protein
MTFDITNWGRVDANKSSRLHTTYSYQSSADAIATIATTSYFDDLLQADGSTYLKIGDIINIKASDANAPYQVTAVDPAITTATY